MIMCGGIEAPGSKERGNNKYGDYKHSASKIREAKTTILDSVNKRWI